MKNGVKDGAGRTPVAGDQVVWAGAVRVVVFTDGLDVHLCPHGLACVAIPVSHAYHVAPMPWLTWDAAARQFVPIWTPRSGELTV